MKRELKQKWLDALRSGNYRQGQDCLKQENDRGRVWYCCLGVLAEIAEPEMLRKERSSFVFYNHTGYLRLPSGEWVLLTADTQRELGRMNDDGKSFAEIADWIEKNVPEDEA
jgi:hypothetical protein